MPKCRVCGHDLPQQTGMTDNGWKDWRRLHTVLFCMEGKTVDLLFEELEPIFRRAKVTAAELEEATLWMVLDEERADAAWKCHYAILMGRINRERQRKHAEAIAKTRSLPIKDHDTRSIIETIASRKP